MQCLCTTGGAAVVSDYVHDACVSSAVRCFPVADRSIDSLASGIIQRFFSRRTCLEGIPLNKFQGQEIQVTLLLQYCFKTMWYSSIDGANSRLDYEYIAVVVSPVGSPFDK